MYTGNHLKKTKPGNLEYINIKKSYIEKKEI